MRKEILKLLICPISGEKLDLIIDQIENDEIKSGKLISERSKNIYLIKNFIPRFVKPDNYAESFGMQWKKFNKTQLDSYSKIKVSYNRFWKATDWSKYNLEKDLILDAGCGNGRFAEICLNSGAEVFCVDYSSSVDICHENLRKYKNCHVIQADIINLPFNKKTFDKIYSLGVLQHTPNPSIAFSSLSNALKNDGKICVDFYEKSIKSIFLPKYWLRPITTKLNQNLVLSIVKCVVPIIFPISRILGKLPFGHIIKRALPVADPLYFYEMEHGKTNLKYKTALEWSILDTFDWLTPTYDNPQSKKDLDKMILKSRIHNLQYLKAGHLVLRN